MIFSRLKMNIFLLVCVILQIGFTLAQKYAAPKCITPDKKIGRCVGIRDCKELLNLLERKNKDSKAIQFLRASQCGIVGSDPKVCCGTGITYNPNIMKPELPDVNTCGTQEVSNKIIGGKGVQLGDYPWMAALGYRNKMYNKYNSKPEWICGGSLISSRYVLTASHCLSGIDQWELSVVRLGDVNLNDTVKDDATPLDVPVEHIVLHEGYKSSPVINDIALVKLKYAVEFTNYIKPICLPVSYELRIHVLDNQYAYVAGWGRTTIEGPFTASSLLQDIRIPIVNVETCKRSYQSIPKSHIDDKNVCAGFLEGKKDSCQGDSGGPLMWINPIDSKYYLIGIVSYGYKCAEPGYPGVYTKVSEYMEWIKLNTM